MYIYSFIQVCEAFTHESGQLLGKAWQNMAKQHFVWGLGVLGPGEGLDVHMLGPAKPVSSNC